MKVRILIFLSLLLSVVACRDVDNSKKIDDIDRIEAISFSVTDSTRFGEVIASKDLGRIKEGMIAESFFAIENNTEGNLVVLAVSSTCGCTDITASRKPIKSGEKSNFRVLYDSNGREGTQFANITIKTNIGEFIVRYEVFVSN